MRLVPTLACVVLLLAADAATAQEFRVYTTVRQLDQPDEPIVSRSLTLFRGSKSYDQLEEIGEVVISDRMRGTSVVLTRQLEGTRVEADELRHFLKVGRTEAANYLQSISDPAARKQVGFTLNPKFTIDYEQSIGRLTMSGGGWTYRIETAEPPDPTYLNAYLDYADRAAAVNFLVHPRATFPAMRQAVNDQLREIGRLPVRVELTAPGEPALQLRADHKYGWKLESFDRTQILRWEGLVGDESGEHVRWSNLRTFQRQTIAER